MALLLPANVSKTLVFGPVAGASSLRETFSAYFFHVRASYGNGAEQIVQQLRLSSTQKVVMFYQDEGFEKTLLTEVRRAADSLKLRLVSEVKVDPINLDFNAAAAELEKAAPRPLP